MQPVSLPPATISIRPKTEIILISVVPLYNLGDPAIEDVLYEAETVRRFLCENSIYFVDVPLLSLFVPINNHS